MNYKTTQTKTMHDYSMKRILKAPKTDITKPYRDVIDEQFKEIDSLKRELILAKALTTYGIEAQTRQTAEEISELIIELSKITIALNKQIRGIGNIKELAEETADVEIMLEQMKMYHGIVRMVESAKKFKVERLEGKLNE